MLPDQEHQNIRNAAGKQRTKRNSGNLVLQKIFFPEPLRLWLK